MLIFCPESHEYLKDGIPIPGVTKVLQEANLVDLKGIPKDILERAWAFGTAVHRACELYDQNNLNEHTLDPALKPYLESWKKFLKDTDFQIEAIEERVCSKRYWYAGTFDRRGILYGKRTVIDLKTGVDFGPAAPIQLAAYMEAYNEEEKTKAPQYRKLIKERAVVKLRADGTYALPGGDFFQKGDFSVFLAALTLRNWQIRKGFKNGKH